MDVYVLLLHLTAAVLFPWYIAAIVTRYCLEYCHWMLFNCREDFWPQHPHRLSYRMVVVLLAFPMDFIHFFWLHVDNLLFYIEPLLLESFIADFMYSTQHFALGPDY